MESFFLACSVVAPLLVYMVIGGFVRRLGIMSVDNFKACNVLVFKCFLPIMLFFDILNADISAVIQPKMYVFAVAAILCIFLITYFLFGKLIDDNADASSMIQGVFRSNFVLYGSIVAANLSGDEGRALAASMSAIVVPIFNILAVILFELKRGGEVKLGKLILNIFKNPLVDAAILGILASLVHLQLPTIIGTPLQTLGKIATPLALVALGGMLSFSSIKSHRKLLVIATIGRLVLVPALGVTAAILLGFRGMQLVVILAIFGTPTAVSSAPMAQVMGGNGALSSEIVASTSVFSILTMFLWIFGLSSLGLF